MHGVIDSLFAFANPREQECEFTVTVAVLIDELEKLNREVKTELNHDLGHTVLRPGINYVTYVGS